MMIPNLKGKHVLFITTKNLDYIRNTQEIRLIKEQAASCTVIGSLDKHYFFRLLAVFFALFTTSASRFDTVFIGFAPQLILPLFKWKFKKNEIIIDFFISMYDTLCHDRKKVKSDSAAGHILHFIDRTALSYADIVICDTNAHGRYFMDEFGVSTDKLYTLYLQADTSIYHPLPDCKPAHLKDKYVVLYFGSILPLQGTSVVLEAMSLLKENKNLYFYFIGPVKGKDTQETCPVSDNISYI
ncbi:MAG: group 1 glycosyl transferase, partial [Lachnospiraceae bacterium]|nr:group 1 glycosyl transferase [Lachnospiraceae bacterium]